MLSDDELPPLPYPHMSSGVAHYHSGFTYAQMREYARAIERAAYERAAQACEAQAAEIKRLRKLAMTTHLFEEAPCFLCGYNGPGYYQPEQHPCAALYHEAMEEQQ